MADENLLGEFLRARRALIGPEHVGIPVLGVRRVPGLRREEVAMLAGISADYYLRLEQGRDRRPSAHHHRCRTGEVAARRAGREPCPLERPRASDHHRRPRPPEER